MGDGQANAADAARTSTSARVSLGMMMWKTLREESGRRPSGHSPRHADLGRAGPGFRPAERDAVKRTRSRTALRCSWVSASRAASAPFTSENEARGHRLRTPQGNAEVGGPNEHRSDLTRPPFPWAPCARRTLPGAQLGVTAEDAIRARHAVAARTSRSAASTTAYVTGSRTS